MFNCTAIYLYDNWSSNATQRSSICGDNCVFMVTSLSLPLPFHLPSGPSSLPFQPCFLASLGAWGSPPLWGLGMMSWENFENVIRGLVHSGALRQQIGGSAQVCTVFWFVIQHVGTVFCTGWCPNIRNMCRRLCDFKLPSSTLCKWITLSHSVRVCDVMYAVCSTAATWGRTRLYDF